MNKEFIPYEQALTLKELGFDEPCLAQYKKYDVGEATLDIGFSKNEIIMQFHKLSKFCSASLYQQAFRWFREKYNLNAEPYTVNMGAIDYCFQIRDLYSEKYVHDNFVGAGASYTGTFDTPEEAELGCLKKLIEIVKEKNE